METIIGEITIKDTSPHSEHKLKNVSIQTSEGNLKRRFLQRLVKVGVVVPSEECVVILGEVLEELNLAYELIDSLTGDILSSEELVEVITEKYEGEIDVLEATTEEKEDEIGDLQADICEATATISEVISKVNGENSVESDE